MSPSLPPPTPGLFMLGNYSSFSVLYFYCIMSFECDVIFIELQHLYNHCLYKCHLAICDFVLSLCKLLLFVKKQGCCIDQIIRWKFIFLTNLICDVAFKRKQSSKLLCGLIYLKIMSSRSQRQCCPKFIPFKLTEGSRQKFIMRFN